MITQLITPEPEPIKYPVVRKNIQTGNVFLFISEKAGYEISNGKITPYLIDYLRSANDTSNWIPIEMKISG